MYGEGVSKTGVLDLAVDLKSSKNQVLGLAMAKNKLGQGRDAVKSLIKDNPELADELEVKIKEKLKN
jgi:recombination protein RecA